MAEINNRKLPAGIQSFKVIREEGYLYVDKTGIVWNLANNGQKYNYLSRPRRFGKSLLVDTLQLYFEGRKDLFDGLKIMQMEKEYYDGYHFSDDNMVDIYNPFSLINALDLSRINNFWAASGATTLLPKFVDNLDVSLEHFDNCYIDSTTLETCDVSDGGAELFLYQSGYLTIKDYEDGVYTLGFPNEEVKQALYKLVVPENRGRKDDCHGQN